MSVRNSCGSAASSDFSWALNKSNQQLLKSNSTTKFLILLQETTSTQLEIELDKLWAQCASLIGFQSVLG